MHLRPELKSPRTHNMTGRLDLGSFLALPASYIAKSLSYGREWMKYLKADGEDAMTWFAFLFKDEDGLPYEFKGL